jgi:hypothetical protein
MVRLVGIAGMRRRSRADSGDRRCPAPVQIMRRARMQHQGAGLRRRRPHRCRGSTIRWSGGRVLAGPAPGGRAQLRMTIRTARSASASCHSAQFLIITARPAAAAHNPHRDANQREQDDTRDRPRVRQLSAVYLRSASRGLYGLQAVRRGGCQPCHPRPARRARGRCREKEIRRQSRQCKIPSPPS